MHAKNQKNTCKDRLTLKAGNEDLNSTYVWSDNSTKSELIVNSSGTYSVEVKTDSGCVKRFEYPAELNSTFRPDLPEDTVVCDSTVLNAGNLGSISYAWFEKDTMPSSEICCGFI